MEGGKGVAWELVWQEGIKWDGSGRIGLIGSRVGWYLDYLGIAMVGRSMDQVQPVHKSNWQEIRFTG